MRPPIFDFNAARNAIVEEVVNRVTSHVKDPAIVLNDAAYHETRRLSAANDSALGDWRNLARRIGRMSESEGRDKVRELALHHARDIAGNFDTRVYKLASRAIAPLIGALLAPRQLAKHMERAFDIRSLDDRVEVQGPIPHLAKLAEKGTLIFTPTHLSNMDSVVFGYALERAGLPPASYGAGKNLFTNPLLSFFMHNLGAYRVDRRLKHSLYKDVLKTYSSVLLERGYHSLFFPGGTRSRSGAVERRLKLGLAGTGVDAFARTTMSGHPQPIYFVPATINYSLTLEAETLIDDFLQEEGKARYIIEDDESTRWGRVAAFVKKLSGMDGSVVVRFSAPLDCFGNAVDEEGRSYDKHGHLIDARSYVLDANDKPCLDADRDVQYTRELGDVICDAFLKDTVVMATHLVAASAFQYLRHAVGHADLFAILRHRDDVLMPRAHLAADVERLRDKARELEIRGRIVLGRGVGTVRGEVLVERALRAFAGYHANPVLEPRGTDILLADTRLLFYYQNRLAGHGLAYDAGAPQSRATNAMNARSMDRMATGLRP